MSRPNRAARVAGVLRREGLRAVRDRLLDRRRDALRRAAFRRVESAELRSLPPPAVVNLLGMPAQLRLGGVPQQLLARLEEESRQRTVALLTPAGAGSRLEVWRDRTHLAVELPGRLAGEPTDLENVALERTLGEALDRLGAGAVHAEGVSGLALGSLRRVAAKRPLVLGVHDFGLFCPRPHLLEEPAQRFCDYSTDERRCTACLRVDWPVAGGFQTARRAVAVELLGSAAAVTFASDFLRREHVRLFPDAGRGRWRVVSPAIPIPASLPARAPATKEPHVAFIGGGQPHKGAAVFLEVVRRARDGIAGGVRWSAYGGGDPALLRQLRAAGIRVRGYYAAGSLPRLLREDGVDLALLLSIVPEAHCFALDECLAAEVPVLALDLGALGERVAQAGGVRVAPERGADGVLEAITAWSSRPAARAAPAPAFTRRPADAAADCLALYRELGLLGG